MSNFDAGLTGLISNPGLRSMDCLWIRFWTKTLKRREQVRKLKWIDYYLKTFRSGFARGYHDLCHQMNTNYGVHR